MLERDPARSRSMSDSQDIYVPLSWTCSPTKEKARKGKGGKGGKESGRLLRFMREVIKTIP